MTLRPYKKTDYWLLTSWWAAHSWVAPDLSMLPETGYIVEDVCAGFLYKTDSQIAWLEFIIANPNSDSQKRANALDLLIDRLCNEAKSQGFKAIFTSVQHKKLLERYKDHGFMVTDQSMINLIKKV